MVANGGFATSPAAFLDGSGFKAGRRPNVPIKHRGQSRLSMAAEFPSIPSFAVHRADGITGGVTTLMDTLPFPAATNGMLLSATESSTVFEPTLPDTSALVAMGSVLVLCVIAGFVWANEVVPVSRTKLAISKSRGDVKEYLDELKEDSVGMPVLEAEAEASVYDSSDSSEAAATMSKANDGSDDIVKPNVGDGRDFERWLFSDWLNSSANRKAGRQKEPAIPVLKDAKWNSGDNPVLVTSAMIGVGVIVAALTERVVV